MKKYFLRGALLAAIFAIGFTIAYKVSPQPSSLPPRQTTLPFAVGPILNNTDSLTYYAPGQYWTNTGGSTFTVSGCGTAAAVTGQGTSGSFTVGTGTSTCTFVVTMGGALGVNAPPAHGWILNMDDVTTSHIQHCINNFTTASLTTGTALCNATVGTGDLIVFDAQPY